MPSTIGASGHLSYGKRRTGPGAVTIGGGSARQSKGKWSQFDTSGSQFVSDEQYGITDIEMGPRTMVTAGSAQRDSPETVDSGNPATQSVGDSRGSDEYPIMGISKTTHVQWTVEETNPQTHAR